MPADTFVLLCIALQSTQFRLAARPCRWFEYMRSRRANSTTPHGQASTSCTGLEGIGLGGTAAVGTSVANSPSSVPPSISGREALSTQFAL